ncbi:Phosphorylase superfamily [Geosmithia morbida]|uniref:Phosphorylase superfamily n=1 Tax=Geosmithia morbida TaxID=1094350 RepID=A0A9P5D592_9HYPO|nr:Phosphorylase superfamily [Geosmithia morbida]KAF4126947.1 Phosphorylase superfamily [Geosmithia morbida]
MVGIGGGAPTKKQDIRLGDVVVGTPSNGRSGIFQYDFGKAVQDGVFKLTRHLDQPPMFLLTAVSSLKATHEGKGHNLKLDVENALDNIRKRNNFARPPTISHRLYKPEVIHPPESPDDCAVVCGSDPASLEIRTERCPDDDDPAIHYGLIASADTVMRNAQFRDKLANKEGVLCFEMEAPGLVNHFPCLVIRGICDYSDSHKNKDWQGYAAMTAAAYARDLLLSIPPDSVQQEKRMTEAFDDVWKSVRGIHEDSHATRATQSTHTALLDRTHQGVPSTSQHAAADDVSAALKPHYMLRFADDPDFIDRPDMMEWMIQQHNIPGHVRMALVGIGGIGFAHWVHERSKDTSIFWVRASTEATFRESYQQIANILSLPRRNERGTDILALVWEWLQREDIASWLMVVDNADDRHMFLPQHMNNGEKSPGSYLPHTGNGRILVTSRNYDVAERLVEGKGIQAVPEMASTQASQLFRTKLGQSSDEDEAPSLIQALGNIPPAVTRSAAYIRKRRGRVIGAYLDAS